jgi:hypothetical protein
MKRPGRADMAPLFPPLREFVAERAALITLWHEGSFDPAALGHEVGLAPRKRGWAEVILAENVAVELGHPATASRAFVLTTSVPGLVQHGDVTLLGPDLDGMRPQERRPFGQVVLLALRDNALPDPFELGNLQYLTHRLPGYMVRSVPGRLWARVSRQARAAGFSLRTLGRALLAAYLGDFPGVSGVEVVLVTSSALDVAALAPVAEQARILAGANQKLSLTASGEIECADLSCEACPEKAVCDALRDLVRARRRTG